MTKSISISATMIRMSALLRAGNKYEWAERLDQYRADLPHGYDFALSQILGLYGGMGSLTDIVLYCDGKPLIDKNNEFAKPGYMSSACNTSDPYPPSLSHPPPSSKVGGSSKKQYGHRER
jgi:hypothetical protein